MSTVQVLVQYVQTSCVHNHDAILAIHLSAGNSLLSSIDSLSTHNCGTCDKGELPCGMQ